MSPACLILQRFPDFRKLKKHVPACPYIQNQVMKTCLCKSAAGRDIAHSPGKLLSQRIQDITGIQDKFNLFPCLLLICPKNSVYFINAIWLLSRCKGETEAALMGTDDRFKK